MGRLRTPIFFALLAVAAIGLVAHTSLFHFFVTDDAFISFVYSKNLVQHGQLVFNLGEKPVEGYTNFLWTLFLAGWMKLGWKPESSSVAWGIAFAIATMATCAWLSRRLRDEAGWSPWDALPALLLAAIPGYACWSSGGLETQMFTFFCTLGTALYLAPRGAASDPTFGSQGGSQGGAILDGEPLRRSAAIAMGLAALTRPEGNLFFALMLAHRGLWKLRKRQFAPSREELQFIGLFLLFVIPHFLWRHHYYGYWFPNTYYIKSSGGVGRLTLGQGVYYFGRFIEAFLVYLLLVPPLAGLWAKPDAGTRRFLRYFALVVPVFFAYVISVGGDFMGLFRFVMPSLPLVALAFSLGLRALATAVTRDGQRLLWLPPIAVAALLCGYLVHDVAVDRAAQIHLGPGASDRGIDTPGYLRWYTEDRAAIGKWFGDYAQPDDYAVVGGAGAQVYYSNMRSLDCYGLSDEHIAHDVPASSHRPGHQKYAPLEYQLKNHPTIITSNYYDIGPAPMERPDAPEWRARGYHYVSVRVPGLSSPWYTFLKRMDRRVGPLEVFKAAPPQFDLQ